MLCLSWIVSLGLWSYVLLYEKLSQVGKSILFLLHEQDKCPNITHTKSKKNTQKDPNTLTCLEFSLNKATKCWEKKQNTC